MFPRRYAIELDSSPTSVRSARKFFVDVARRLHLPPDLVARGEVVVSELVTNAVAHARGPIVLLAHRRDPYVRIEVADGDPRAPHMNEPSPDRPGARGLPIVAAMAAEWGWDTGTDGAGKRVWFTLPSSRSSD